jgi:hypothetical protein
MEKPGRRHRGWGRVGLVVVALVALANGGCLLVAAGAAGAAYAGYCYSKGRYCQTYDAAFADAWAATHAALADLGLPVCQEGQAADGGFVESRTGDGDRVRIQLTVQHTFPAEGPRTSVCVRVATFGDAAVSDRILEQVGAHLVVAPPAGPPPAAPEAPANPPQSPPPPLAQ